MGAGQRVVAGFLVGARAVVHLTVANAPLVRFGVQNSGPTGTVNLTFISRFMRFENLATYQPPM